MVTLVKKKSTAKAAERDVPFPRLVSNWFSLWSAKQAEIVFHHFITAFFSSKLFVSSSYCQTATCSAAQTSESGGWCQARMLHVSWSEAGGSPQLTQSPHLINHMSHPKREIAAPFLQCVTCHIQTYTHTRVRVKGTQRQGLSLIRS